VTDDISAPFPQVTWPDSSILTVFSGDNSAVITKYTIHLAQDTPDDLLAQVAVAPILPYVAQP